MKAVIMERIAAGEVLLLVDGLDEITDPQVRIQFCQELERTADRALDTVTSQARTQLERALLQRLSSLAAPVFFGADGPVAAISISAPKGRLPATRMREVVRSLLREIAATPSASQAAG